jgi:hypothetical protein
MSFHSRIICAFEINKWFIIIFIMNGIKFIPIDKSQITLSHLKYVQVHPLIIISQLL